MSADAAVHARRPHDLRMAGAAFLLLFGLCWLATAGVSSAEQRIFEPFNELPNWLEQVLWAPMQLGSLFGPLFVAVVGWRHVGRDWRPAVGALVAGVVAWQLAKIVKDIIERGRPHSELVDMVRRGGTPTEGLGFVSGHAAVAFTLATVISPYVRREWRWAPVRPRGRRRRRQGARRRTLPAGRRRWCHAGVRGCLPLALRRRRADRHHAVRPG